MAIYPSNLSLKGVIDHLRTSQDSAPNTGDGLVHWNNLTGVPDEVLNGGGGGGATFVGGLGTKAFSLHLDTYPAYSGGTWMNYAGLSNVTLSTYSYPSATPTPTLKQTALGASGAVSLPFNSGNGLRSFAITCPDLASTGITLFSTTFPNSYGNVTLYAKAASSHTFFQNPSSTTYRHFGSSFYGMNNPTVEEMHCLLNWSYHAVNSGYFEDSYAVSRPVGVMTDSSGTFGVFSDYSNWMSGLLTVIIDGYVK